MSATESEAGAPASSTLGKLPILSMLVCSLAATFAFHKLDDSDTWWHLAAGRWIVTHRAVPRTDTLSYTVLDHAWINLQWLFDVALYGLYQLGGAHLLVVTSALCYVSAIALVVLGLRLHLGPVTAAFVALWVTCIAAERFVVRPEMISFVLLPAVVWLCATARRDDGRRLWFLPPLMLLWVNSHALFVVGVLVIGCHVVAELAAVSPLLPRALRPTSVLSAAGRKRLWLAAGASLVATVVNPFFLEGALFPLELASRIGRGTVFQSIGELAPSFLGEIDTPFLGAFRAFFVVATGVVVLATALYVMPVRRAPAQRKRANVPPQRVAHVEYDVAGLLVFVCLAYLSLSARRNMALFALGTAPFLAQCLRLLASRMPVNLRSARRGATAAFALALSVVIVAGIWFVASNRFYRFTVQARETGTGVLDASFPVRASAFVAETDLPGKPFNDLTSGGYLAWAAPFEDGVYIDGRLEVYDAEFFAQYSTVLADPRRFRVEAARQGVETVVLFHRWGNRHALIASLFHDREWAFVYHDEVAIVFVRAAGNLERIQRARARFMPMREETKQRLLGPVDSWQWPAGRAEALWSYASLLAAMADWGVAEPDAAVPFYRRLLELEPDRATAAAVRGYLSSRQARTQ